MATSMLLGIFDWVRDFFTELINLIPKIIYLLYASLACVIDVLQLFFRKLAGLDVYYVDGKAVSGDLVTNFIAGILGININATDGVTFEYSALTTVFWSFIVFGIIIAFMSTIVAIVKSHYSYDDKSAKGPMQYVYTAGKAIINMVAVPIIVVLGLYVSQGILTALDTMTSTSSGSVVSMFGEGEKDERGNLISEGVGIDFLSKPTETSQSATGLNKSKTYIYYDIFGFGGGIVYGNSSSAEVPSSKTLALIGSKNQTFSGSLFKVGAYNGNRARLGQYQISSNFLGSKSNDCKLFGNAKTDTELASMIDNAFACNLHLKQSYNMTNWNRFSSDKFFTNYLCQNTSAFSKFNVGLVWYYYDLWQFNFIVGFAGCIVCATLFVNIIMGLIARLFMCIGLFLVAPPLFGLAPLDGGKAGKSWRENFMKQVLMAYGAVVGMNIFFLILPYMNEIDFFNIAIADYLAQTLIIIVGLITVKAFIATLSGLIGAADANETGGKITEEVGTVAGKATKMTVGAAKMAAKLPVNAVRGGLAVKNKAQETFHAGKAWVNQHKLNNISKYQRQRDALSALDGKKASDVKKSDFIADYMSKGGSKREAAQLWKTVSAEKKSKGSSSFTRADLEKSFKARSGAYKKAAGKYSGRSGGLALARDKQTLTKARDRAKILKDYRQERFKAHQGGLLELRDTVLSPFSNVDSVMGDSKFYSAFKDKSGIAPKPDWTKQTAQNVEALTKEVQGGRGDVRGGFETLNTGMGRGFKNTNRRQDRMRRDMNAGFADTGAKLDAANITLSGIEADTEATKKATQRIARETDGLKARQKKVIAQNREAHADLKKAQDKLDVIVKDPQNKRNQKI